MFQTTNQIYVYIYIYCFDVLWIFLELIRFLRVQLLWSTRGYLNMCLSPTGILRGLPCPLPLAMPPKSDHLGAWDHRKNHRFRRKTVTALCSKHLRTQPEPALDVSSSDPSAWCPSTICLAEIDTQVPYIQRQKKTWVSPGCPSVQVWLHDSSCSA